MNKFDEVDFDYDDVLTEDLKECLAPKPPNLADENNKLNQLEEEPKSVSTEKPVEPKNFDQGKIFVGGLSWDTNEESLREYFSSFGEILEVLLMKDHMSGRSRGFGFVTFEDPKSIDLVVSQEHHLDGKRIDPKRAMTKDEQEGVDKIFVGGIHFDATEEELAEYFSKFGKVKDTVIMKDRVTGKPRGFGFVTFESAEAGSKATDPSVELEFKGRHIDVKPAAPRPRQQRQQNNQQQQYSYGYNNYAPMYGGNMMMQGGYINPAMVPSGAYVNPAMMYYPSASSEGASLEQSQNKYDSADEPGQLAGDSESSPNKRSQNTGQSGQANYDEYAYNSMMMNQYYYPNYYPADSQQQVHGQYDHNPRDDRSVNDRNFDRRDRRRNGHDEYERRPRGGSDNRHARGYHPYTR